MRNADSSRGAAAINPTTPSARTARKSLTLIVTSTSETGTRMRSNGLALLNSPRSMVSELMAPMFSGAISSQNQARPMPKRIWPIVPLRGNLFRNPCTMAGFASITACAPINQAARIRPTVKSDRCS